MMIKDLDAGVVRVWEGLRPTTKKMLVGILETAGSSPANVQPQIYGYDAHSDWELSRLLSALDEHGKGKEAGAGGEAVQLAETCAQILEAQSGSAEVFIQLATRAIKLHDYRKLDALADVLAERFAPGEIAEIVRQSELPQIRAIAYETLSMLSLRSLVMLMDDPLYSDISANAIEQQAYEYESEDARAFLEQLDEEADLGDPRN
ncbi:MAG TPA: hypothetical protein VK918_03010 [Pyrinomonadaceae bacterium]|nr:hypothetical protein [Pyrinomonadaceae bacterium]